MKSLADYQNRINQLKNKTKKSDENKKYSKDDYWKPTDEHDVRLFAYPHGDPVVEMVTHYNLGPVRALNCPKSVGKDCAVCDYCYYLRGYKDSTGKQFSDEQRSAHFEIFKKIKPISSFYVPVVERGKEADGSKFWRMSETQFEEIMKICSRTDRQGACEVSPDDGLQVLLNADKAYDLHVSVKAAGNKDNKGNTKTFPVVDIEAGILITKLHKDKAVRDKLKASVKDLKTMFNEPTTEAAQKAVDGFMPSLGTDTTTSDSKAPDEAVNSSESAETFVGGRDMMSALDELANS